MEAKRSRGLGRGDRSASPDELIGRRIALASVIAGVVLSATKILVGVHVGSTAVLSDGVETAGDVLSSALALAGLWLASKPPDYEHPYGHGRYETLAGLAIGAMLLLSGAVIFWHGFTSLGERSQLQAYALYPLLAAVFVKITFAALKLRAARRIDSASLEADAWHDLTDLLSTSVALAAVLMTLSKSARFGVADHVGGMLIGVIRVKSGLSSFIVTLAFLFILRGATIVSARILHGSTLVGGMREAKLTDPIAWLFGGQFGLGVFRWLADHGMLAKLPNGTPTVTGLPMIILWCLVLGAAAAFVLANSRFGNWIFSAGGDPRAAAEVGVPVGRVKIRLFVYSAFCASVFGAAQVFEYGSADASRGELKEFESIIAAVIGGALLTGGYGSVIGALVGALIFGVVSQGFFYTGVDGDWFRIFLGCVLLGAVAFNTQLRKRVTGGY